MRYVPVNPMLDRNAHIHGDEDYTELSRGDLALIERKAERLCTAKLVSADWWNECLEAVSPLTADLPSQLARMMANLAHARRGEPIAIDAITTALSQIERTARLAAMTEARDEAEEALERGEL